MLGTIVNAIAIIVGSLIGLKIKHGLKENYKNIIMQSIPLCVIFIGAASTLSGLSDKNSNPILFIISLVIGGIIGEWLNIEGKLEYLGLKLQNKMKTTDNNIAKGFVTSTLIFCVGTMAILGALESGLKGNHNMLFAKAVLDGITSIILTSSMGIGVAFSAIAVFLYQGSIALFSSVIAPYISQDILREISIVGGILIFSIALTMLEIKKIKTGNLLPAIIIPVIYYLICIPLYCEITMIFSKWE